MSKGATTIVVGGGIMGATTLWELAKGGMDALLLEAGGFGLESTGKSAAIVRGHYSNPQVVRMAVRSRDALMRLPELTGCEPVYTKVGWLFLVDEADTELAKQNRAMQIAEGSLSVEVDDLGAIVPGIRTDGIAYALYEEASGFADPVATTEAYIEAARRLGARAQDRSPAQAVIVEGGRVKGVQVNGEVLPCENVVLAAGAWTHKLSAGFGLELPVQITREQDVVFDTGAEATIPCSISAQIDRVYMRPAPEYGPAALLIGRGFPKDYENVEPDGYDTTVSDVFEADVRKRLVDRIPRLAGVKKVDGRAGLYTVTPDWHPLLGPVDGFEGVYLATGGSGHCFKLGPAIGELVGNALLGKSVDYADIASFSLSRYAEGREFRSTYGGNRA